LRVWRMVPRQTVDEDLCMNEVDEEIVSNKEI